MSSVLFEGCDLWYQVTGKGHPLTLIGGYGLLHNQWGFVTPYLENDCRVVNWNYRGSGKSTWNLTTPYSVEMWVEDMRAVLDSAAIQKTDIWATSTGSFIGIRFAAKYPERTRSLITYPSFKRDDVWRNIIQVAHDVTHSFGAFSLARLYAGVVLPPDSLYAREGIDFEKFEAQCFEENVNPRTLKSVSDAYCNVDLSDNVASLTCPILLLIGSESRLNDQKSFANVSFEKLIADFRQLNPKAEVAAIPDSGNSYCMITRPKETARVVVDFLNRLDC